MAADERAGSSAASEQLQEQPRIATAADKSARRKRYYAERDASKVYLFDEHDRWRSLKEELSAKSDRALAKILLDHYLSDKARNPSPEGKKVRSKPEIEKHLLEYHGEQKDLANFDYRSGKLVERKKQRYPKKCQSKNTDAISEKFPLSFVSYEFNSNGVASKLEHVPNEVGLVPPRQLYWERQLQTLNSNNGLVDFDVCSDQNGEFSSLLHSIVNTLQIERDLAKRQKPVTAESAGISKKPKKKKLIKITKTDIRKQENEVWKARRDLAKAIVEYEALK